MTGQMTPGSFLKQAIRAMVIGLGLTGPVVAQDNPFAPYLYVGDRVITVYELDQRARFLSLLRAPGDPLTEARKALIDDKLRLIAAEQQGLTLTDEALRTGLEEFAGRANLNAEQFVAALAQGGVEAETFRDFVEAGLLWREIVRGRYAGQVTISEADIDRVIASTAQQTKVRLLVSELVLAAPPGQEGAVMERARALRESIRAGGNFAAAARRNSASPSAGAGGALDWLPLENLPPQLTGLLLGLEPGDISEPVAVPNAVVLFQLRDIEETVGAAATGVQVEYAQYLIPDDANAGAEVARLRNVVDRCPELYAEAQGQPEGQLQVTTTTMAEVPGDIGLELAKLDINEASAGLVRAGATRSRRCPRLFSTGLRRAKHRRRRPQMRRQTAKGSGRKC
ncbi:MAG: peptidylprolyl isomerase [Rhodobacteraceae bacterium]|nr:peptidylprolyl isomerase [Paracoccaceae bacterium]